MLRAAINNGENKFREKVRERNTRFTWFDKLSTSTGERAAVIKGIFGQDCSFWRVRLVGRV